MPKPFLELTLDQFAEMLAQFPWRRRITGVHVHHTFRPNHADFASRPPIQSIEGMFRFHTEERHFSDIAQHVTIDPRGVIWTGRNWNVAPASATGFNGNSTVGPFMFEMIGDFDLGQDRWEGAQRDAAIEVIARVQRLFGLAPDAFHFHNEMSPKTCPGTAINKADVLDAVRAAHEGIAIPRTVRRGAFGEEASPERATVDRILQVFDVHPRGSRALSEEVELPESDMTLREGEMSSGAPSAFVSARDADMRDLTPEDFALLRRHVINLRMGALLQRRHVSDLGRRCPCVVCRAPAGVSCRAQATARRREAEAGVLRPWRLERRGAEPQERAQPDSVLPREPLLSGVLRVGDRRQRDAARHSRPDRRARSGTGRRERARLRHHGLHRSRIWNWRFGTSASPCGRT